MGSDLEKSTSDRWNDEEFYDDGGGMLDGTITPTASRFGTSCLSLFQWKRSFFKLVWKQAVVYYVVYVSLTLIFNHLLDDAQKASFQGLAFYVSKYGVSLPVVLLLGFFNSLAMSRWFSIVASIPGTSKMITKFIATLKEDVPNGETIIDEYSRYVLLDWLLIFRMVCKPLRKRYPTMMSLEACGFLSRSERIQLERIEERGDVAKRTLPLVVSNWLVVFLREVNRRDYFGNSGDYERHVDAVLSLKKNGGKVINFATNNIPVALIQSVTIAIYCFGFVSVIGHQFSEKSVYARIISGYFPFLYAMPYFLYYVWLQVGRIAADPFGEDEDDIDMVLLFHNHVADSLRQREIYRQRMDHLF